MNKGRKITGGKYHAQYKKKKFERVGQGRHTVLGEVKLKQLRTQGGTRKVVTLKTNFANVLKGKKIEKTEIKNVIQTPQNRFFARQNRLMKGAIIETALGKARITNRPTQEGCVNAILIQS